MADADVSAAAGDAFKPLSGGRPHVDAADMPASLVEVSGTASGVIERTFMGLKGTAWVMVNLGFAGLMGLAFIWLLGHELPLERALYREDLKEQRQHDAKETAVMVAAVQGLGKAIEVNQQSIITMQGNIRDMQIILRDLATDVKRIKPLAQPAPRVIDEGEGLLIFPAGKPDKAGHGSNKPAAAPAKKAG